MSAEDKIAAIRREVEERADDFDSRSPNRKALLACEGVVIYGVPLGEMEAEDLRMLVDEHRRRFTFDWATRFPHLAAIWEMLERGKK